MLRCTFFLLTAACCFAQTAPPPRIFEPAQVEAVYRVVLDRNALLLESVRQVIADKGVRDGHVQITAGSVSECTYHFVASTALKPRDLFKTVQGPFEILHGGGIIADGEPHIHISLADSRLGAFGGHLENGCRIRYLGEVTVIKYSGEALTRRKNSQGVSLLDKK